MIENITLVLVSHRSKKKIINFLNGFSKKIKIIIVENSNDFSIEYEIKKLNKNIILKKIENNGYGNAINYARKFVNTKYFFIFNPDIENIVEKDIEVFLKVAQKLKDKFACIGPRYSNISEKTLKQSDKNFEISKIKSISGAAMFFNAKVFDQLKGFDENFFLYFEETDYCYRANKKGLSSYQINTINVYHKVGTSVEICSEIEKKNLNDLHNWHFTWSKLYFYKKKYGLFYTILLFVPQILRTLIKLSFYSIIVKNKILKRKYKLRYNAIKTSLLGKNSSFRT